METNNLKNRGNSLRQTMIAIILLIVFVCNSTIEIFGQIDDVPKRYDKVEKYKDDGFAMVRLAGKVGLIDKNGNEVVPCIYENINGTIAIYKDGYISAYFSEGLASAKRDDKWGFVNQEGKEVTPFVYDNIRPCLESMAQVELAGKFGFIESSGKEVIPCKYSGAGDFEKGIAAVELNGKWIYIDKEGNEYATKKIAQKALKKAAGK